MKIFNTLILSAFILMTALTCLSAQDAESLAFEEAMIWQQRLFLSQEQTTKLEASLLRFNENYKKLMVDVYSDDKSFSARYEKLMDSRNKEIQKLIGQQSYFVFSRMEKNRIESAKTFFDSFLALYTTDEGLASELTAYHSHSVLPIMRSYRNAFQEALNVEDSLKLVSYSMDFREALHSFSSNVQSKPEKAIDFNKMLKAIGKESAGNKKVVKGIKKLSRVYKDELSEAMVALDPFLVAWKKDIVDIFSNHLSREEVKTGTRILGALGAYGVSKKVNRTSFLLFDPSYDAGYFDLKMSLYSLFFQQMLK